MEKIKMRVLWVCNIVLPELCIEFGFKQVQVGGWLTGMWELLRENDELELAVCIPIWDKNRMKNGSNLGYQYYSFPMVTKESDIAVQKNRFIEIMADFKPDIIHIWGTEYFHSYSMILACEELSLLKKVIVNVQGLVSVYAKHYGYGLTEEILKSDLIGKTIQDEIREFEQRGNYEKIVIQKVSHIIGRTEWDKACSTQINHSLKYYTCGEILRKSFYYYPEKWDFDKCKKYSIFVSQAGYPVKGFHLVLETIAKLAKQYQKLQVYVAGTDVRKLDTRYGEYIREKIKEYHLEKVVCFVGMISEEEMYRYYLKANVFLSASTIENSSNSVCEAMMVGTPVVSSYVGGIPTIITHGNSGFLYPLDAPYMMQYYVKQLFENKSLAVEISNKAKSRAEEYNNRDFIIRKMLGIYQIVNKGDFNKI